jgi:hypothetical protein
MKNITKLAIGLAVLGVLTPIGLLASGDAWGEWGKEAFKTMIGFIPKGLERFSDFWRAPFADYTVSGTGDYIGYILSAFGGMLLVILVTWVAGKLLARKNNHNTGS